MPSAQIRTKLRSRFKP